ncbi:MAG: restriction endonuclease subunit S, partial [Terrisporobacter sp.]
MNKKLPEGWKESTLEYVCDFINGDRGKNYPSGSDIVEKGIPFINAGHIQNNKINLESMNFITKEKFASLGSGKIQRNDIVYCLRGSLGKNGIVDIDKGAIASSLVIMRCKKNIINHKYLMYVLNSKSIKKQQIRDNNGSTQPNLSASSVKQFKINIPPLEEQERIVSILERAEGTIYKREESLALLDELVKSKFIEMFGDPVLNSKKW